MVLAPEVTVREPFPEYAWPEAWLWTRDLRGRIMDDFGPRTLEEFVVWAVRTSERARTWGVWKSGELGGLVTFEAHNPVMGVSHVVFRKTFWGRATTVAALRAVYGEVFSSGIQKIASVVFEDNHAVRALARRGGAREEGVLRAHTLRGGKPASMIALGILKEEFERGINGSVGSTGGSGGQHDGSKDQHGVVDEHADVHGGPERAAELGGERAPGPADEGSEPNSTTDGRNRPDQ